MSDPPLIAGLGPTRTSMVRIRNSDVPLLVAGLGNPGEKYAGHRHNVGFLVADAIHAKHRFGNWRQRFHGYISEGMLGGRKTLLFKPMAYMNESGRAVREAVSFLKLPLSSLVVVHDELDLAPGKVRAKTGGGDAGHNGLRSITAALGPDYRRVRIGIGHPGRHAVLAYALRDFSKADREWLLPLLDAVADAAPYLAAEDDPGFMNRVALLTKPQRPGKPKENEPDGL